MAMIKTPLRLVAVATTVWLASVGWQVSAQPAGFEVVHVRYGYFSETRHILAACGRGWFDLALPDTNTYYKVGCYPQSSGNFVSSRLDSNQLDIAHIGSTPWAQAVARGVHAKEVYTSHQMGESQGIYVRPDDASLNYTGIVTPYDLRGRVVGVPFGSTTHYQTLFLIDLLGLQGDVQVVNMSPTEIIKAWDANPPTIDAAAVWGTARDHVLRGGGNPSRAANTLLSSGVISDWGRATYVVVAASRTFAEEHAVFLEHFVGVASRVADSFIDFLGAIDPTNTQRWEPNLLPRSMIPSMVDAIMLEDEEHTKPSEDALFDRRSQLDLFEDNDAFTQLSCQFMGSGRGSCPFPTSQHWSLAETADFLVEQKTLASVGVMSNMGDDGNCQDQETFCGGDIIDGSFLQESRRDCSNCLYVGPYGDTVAPVASFRGEPDYLLRALELQDNITARSRFANVEAGRRGGDSTSCTGVPNRIASNSVVAGRVGDGADGIQGRSYSDDLYCEWEIRGVDCETPFDSCESLVQLDFEVLRVWSGDLVRIYADPSFRCTSNSTSSYLIAQASGFDDLPPSVRAKGCLRLVFETDLNVEKSYAINDGDGIVVRYDRDHPGCLSDADCNDHTCVDGLCKCDGQEYGADCSYEGHCFGTSRVALINRQPKVIASRSSLAAEGILQSGLRILTDPRSLDPGITYPNDAVCSFEIEVPAGSDFVQVQIVHDLEPTHDLVSLLRGSGADAEPIAMLTGTHRRSGVQDTYYVPVDDQGIATVRFQTDARGRRRGFVANLLNIDSRTLSGSYLSGDIPCPIGGQSGFNCEVPYCIQENRLVLSNTVSSSAYNLGRVVSQTPELGVPAMPWAPQGGCTWTLTPEGLPPSTTDAVSLRLVFNNEKSLDLEEFPISAVGDKLVIHQRQGPDQFSEEFFVEKCETDETCSFNWQTGVCGDNGGCELRTTIEVPLNAFDESSLDPLITSVALITDRNDRGVSHFGLDFDVTLVKECPGEGTCEDFGGICTDGFCYCAGIACSCSCDEVGDVISTGVKMGIVLGVLAPVFTCLFVGFYFYRRRKIRQSREQKKIIEEKEAELEQFRNSVVGMRAAIADYIPKAPLKKEQAVSLVPKVQWCWRETDFCMDNHDEDEIYGTSSDCWIKYGNSDVLETAYQKQKGKGSMVPLPGYTLDFAKMQQTKNATGFQREVRRFVEKVEEDVKVDLDAVAVGANLPSDLAGEPQMILVKGDIVQISKQRDDGWAFGTKLHHQDEALARRLLAVATTEDDSSGDDTEILTDTGWFPLDQTQQPTGDDLAVLQSQVGDTGELAPPQYWDDVMDPTAVQLHDLKPGDPERDAVVQAFQFTLVPPQFNNVKIVRVQRVQNLAMWQSYVVKRQTICYREHFDASSGPGSPGYQRALARFERRWLWHGTNAEVMDKILQQGFNRSFCGKNATVYGKGVYFARDASYSAYKIYAVPDKKGIQYMMACRVVVGEYCRGKTDALTPDLRDASKNMLYDTTVGLLGSDTMSSPSIYVTYHDSQAYPEYLIAFKAT